MTSHVTSHVIYIKIIHRKKKPVGGVSLFPGADLFSSFDKSSEDQLHSSSPPKTQPKPVKNKSTLGGASLFDEDDDIFNLSPAVTKNET